MLRTDLAEEAYRLWRQDAGSTSSLPGVRARERTLYGIDATLVDILDPEGEKALCKPIGRYVTLEAQGCLRKEGESFKNTCLALSELLRAICRSIEGSTLVACLGNREVTPDSIGPRTARHIFATRHLMDSGELSPESFSSVAVLEPGVLGATGMESADIIRGAVGELHPARIIAVDALASADPERLCRTIQLSDTGIVPGSGVGNHRAALTKEFMGIPVIALGVPTVIDSDVFAGKEHPGGMMVTPREIDFRAAEVSRALGIGINLALHPGLRYEEAVGM